MEYRDRRPTTGIAKALRVVATQRRPAHSKTLSALEAEFRRGATVHDVRKAQAMPHYEEPAK